MLPTTLGFHKLVCMRGIQIEPEDLFDLGDPSDGFGPERRFAFERVEHDAFEQIPERDIVVLGKRFQHFDQALLHADTGLSALDRYHGTMVPRVVLDRQLRETGRRGRAGARNWVARQPPGVRADDARGAANVLMLTRDGTRALLGRSRDLLGNSGRFSDRFRPFVVALPLGSCGVVPVTEDEAQSGFGGPYAGRAALLSSRRQLLICQLSGLFRRRRSLGASDVAICRRGRCNLR